MNFAKVIQISSPNFNKRKINCSINFIIIHYTGMTSEQDALDRLTSSSSKVSAHWLINENGKLYNLVQERFSAWHAGVSYWKGIKNLNDYSIGIELVNKGHPTNNKFPNLQMLTLEKLLKNILIRYNLAPTAVLGHSDIAPARKIDPGEFFDWQRLSLAGVAFWPAIVKKSSTIRLFSIGDKGKEILYFQNYLSKIGYKININGLYDTSTKKVVEAFQRRFLPKKIDGRVNGKVYARIEEVFHNIP